MKKELNVAKSFAGRVGAVAGAGVIAATMWLGLGGSMGAAPRALAPEADTCLPTCDVDGRHLVVAGDDNTTLGAQSVAIGLTYNVAVSGETNFDFALYDGDNDASHWDVPFDDGLTPFDPTDDPAAPALIVELYTDPLGDGTGTGGTPIATWTPGQSASGIEHGPFPVVNNGWAASGLNFLHDEAANDGSDHYNYVVKITPQNPAVDKGWNVFKVRTAGTVTLLKDQVVGFIASMNVGDENNVGDRTAIYPGWTDYFTPDLTNSTYDGTWIFKTNLTGTLNTVEVFDGDMDFGTADCVYTDTDDQDSPSLPTFPSPAAVPQGVATGGDDCDGTPGGATATGQPADDTLAPGYLRTPTALTGVPLNIAYQLKAPDGQIFLNQNPSGNREWEQFRIVKVQPADDPGGDKCPAGGFAASPGFTEPDIPGDNLYPASDCRTTSLPSGPWEVQLDGMDMMNLNFWFFSFKVTPVEPPCEGAECPGEGLITPTTETCQDFVSGDIETEYTMFYRKAGNKIAQVNPGVIFYYAVVTVAPGEVLSVSQSVAPGTGPIFGLHQNDARLYTPTCGGVPVTVSYDAATGEVTYGGAAVAAGGTFIIRLKLSGASLKGQAPPNPTPGLYTFVAELDGVPEPSTANATPLALTQK